MRNREKLRQEVGGQDEASAEEFGVAESYELSEIESEEEREEYFEELEKRSKLGKELMKLEGEREKLEKALKEGEENPEIESEIRDLDKKITEVKEKILLALGVEKDPEGRIIIYHATLERNYAKIERDRVIRPAIKTGERGWRVKGEEEAEKLEKIYLATKEEAEKIAERLQSEYGGSALVLEVHVEENNLYPDEDTRDKTWYGSLNSLKTCSFKGEIKAYQIFRKLDFQLSRDKKIGYINKAVKAGTPEEKEKIQQEFKEEAERAAIEEKTEIARIMSEKRE